MLIDITIAVFAFILMVIGYFAGALIQIVKIAALVCSYFIASWSAPILSAIMVEQLGLNFMAHEMVSMGVCWTLSYFILVMIGKAFAETINDNSESFSSADQVLGLLVGLLKAVVFVVLMVYVIGMFKEQIFKYRPEVRETFSESLVMQALSKTSLVEKFLPDEMVGLLHLSRDMSDKVKAKRIQESDEAQNLIKNPIINELLQDEAFQKKAREGDVLELMKDDRLMKALQDKEVVDLLNKLGSGAVYNQKND